MLLSQLQGFTLTMWDVKKLKIPTQKIPYYPFYLNYVGCKDSLSSFVVSPFVCFTLTMWDVKVLDLEEGMTQYEFYLNYVGCKVSRTQQ